jgi:hypothetical protein
MDVPFISPGIKFAVETESEDFRQIVPVGVPAQDDMEHATGNGALGGISIMKAPFGFIAFLGTVSPIGVIVSHIIVLVDFIEEGRQEGVPLQTALLDAGIVRLRPVLITVGATVIALIPPALHRGVLPDRRPDSGEVRYPAAGSGALRGLRHGPEAGQVGKGDGVGEFPSPPPPGLHARDGDFSGWQRSFRLAPGKTWFPTASPVIRLAPPPPYLEASRDPGATLRVRQSRQKRSGAGSSCFVALAIRSRTAVRLEIEQNQLFAGIG